MTRPLAVPLVVVVLALAPAAARAQIPTFIPTPAPQAVPEEPSEAELALRESTVAVAFDVFVGGANTQNADGFMDALGYTSDDQVLGADVAMTFRTAPWLWVGARSGFRTRTWERGTGPSAGALGADLLGLVELRFPVGRTFDFVLFAAAGLGQVVWQIEDGAMAGFAPRLSGGMQLGMSLSGAVRVTTRFAYDLFEWTDAKGSGLDVDLGGATLALGLEVRT